MSHRNLRLSDLASEGVDVQLCCRRCGNRVLASVRQLADHFGPSSMLGGLSGHFKCPLCGSVTIDATPDSCQHHPPTWPSSRHRYH